MYRGEGAVNGWRTPSPFLFNMEARIINESKIYRFDPVIYPYPLYVAMEYKVKEIESVFLHLLSQDETEELNLDVTSTNILKSATVKDRLTGEVGYLVIVCDPIRATVGTMAHEALHINSFNNALLGFEAPTYENDEQNAYYIQWVADSINSVIGGFPEEEGGIRIMTEE